MGKRIQVRKPLYFCEECGSKERKVNVVGGRVLCHDCTILELRKLDANQCNTDKRVTFSNRTHWVPSSEALELLKRLVKDGVYG